MLSRILNPQVIRYRNVSRLCRGAIFKISTRSLCHTTAEANRTGLKKYLIPITLSAIGITAYTLISIKNNIECIKAFEVLQHLREEHDGDLPLFSPDPRDFHVTWQLVCAALDVANLSKLTKEQKKIHLNYARHVLLKSQLIPNITNTATIMEKATESVQALKAEELYNQNCFDRRKLFEQLRQDHEADPQDVGVAWRLARAAYDVANLKATPKEEKKELIYYARDIIQKAHDITQDDAQVHNWMGIILSSIGEYEGSKVSIANSYLIKRHWKKSIKLNPTNATTYHLLGRWCVAIADLSWIERNAATVLFGLPPESSYDEALNFLHKSEDLAPGTWKKNTFLIAQVYYKKKDYLKAKEWTEKALKVPVKTEEDETVHEEATALLKKL